MDRRDESSPSTTVPADVRPKFEAITALTDAFCRQHLTEEYAEMCRGLAAALARKRPTPLARGKEEVWASGIVRTIGSVNFLDDPSQKPHMKLTGIDKAFGVAESTGQAKSKSIRTLLRIGQLDPKWTLSSRLGDNPMVWMAEVNGFMVDLRDAPRQWQEAAFQKGLIPYVPADRKG